MILAASCILAKGLGKKISNSKFHPLHDGRCLPVAGASSFGEVGFACLSKATAVHPPKFGKQEPGEGKNCEAKREDRCATVAVVGGK